MPFLYTNQKIMNNKPNKNDITEWFKGLQDRICQSLEALDGEGRFQQDLWQHKSGGGGRTRILQNGGLIEKGGVNFSAVQGVLNEKMSRHLNLQLHCPFYATGVSIVLHPSNPHMPIIHMNVRYFEVDDSLEWWFGGGIDLTPHYIIKEDAQFFHRQLKDACDKHDPAYHPHFKKRADDYFYLKHRDETRGIGGIFFDHLETTDTHSKEDRFAFVQEVGEAFVPIYTYFAKKYKHTAFTEQEKKWQLLRRSRYVEFNLLFDRGTKFGIDTNARIESIFMSMPPLARWGYNVQPEAGSREAQTLALLKKGINWI